MDRLRFNLNKATALCSTCSKSCPVKPAKEESDAIRYNARFLPQYWSSNKLLGLSSEGYRVPDELLPTCDAASSWERSWIFCCCWTSTSWIESRVCCSWLTVKNKQSKRRQSDSSLSFKKERTKKKDVQLHVLWWSYLIDTKQLFSFHNDRTDETRVTDQSGPLRIVIKANTG